ncbi:hypothetical protein MG293_013066 [Ovis ammon polii]|uniref:Uncharacterized protein n=1 Tax=Ovis ammon polii TaxID=230172 RepID=A0AAD4Y752_OVIAM|nr:hypothetical protein MG293_013066 [Ovis ammon polii]
MEGSIHLSGLISRHDDEATRTSTSEGLEEGEVEGETLLIVESEDQASVDLSHDHSGDSLNSDEGDVSWMEEQLSYFCDKCQKWIPASKELLLSFALSVPVGRCFLTYERDKNVKEI